MFTGDIKGRLKTQAERHRKAAQPTPGPEPTPESKHRKPTSVLAADARIVGDVAFTGDLQVDGLVQGDVQGGSLDIGEKGRVEGRIAAEEIRIGGLVTGGVDGRSVTVAKTGRVLSSVDYVVLAVEAGAQLHGMITPRGAASVAEVVTRVPPLRPRSASEGQAKTGGTAAKPARSGIRFAPNPKSDRQPYG